LLSVVGANGVEPLTYAL